MLKGIVKKAVGGFYYVILPDSKRILECKARGKFKVKGSGILVGDKVKVSQQDQETWVIEEILPRKNRLEKPSVANIDKAVVVFSTQNPDVKLLLVDKFLVQCELNNIEPVLCLNKIDIADQEDVEKRVSIYTKVGYKVILTSAKKNQGVDELKRELAGNVSVFVGPSGVGKSSLLNCIQPGLKLKTGSLSKKIKRGRHTTRHVELLELGTGGYVCDTPGFGYIDLRELKECRLDLLFPEMHKHIHDCKFRSCIHYKEPQCGVKEALQKGLIPKIRYKNYLKILEEIKNS